MLHEAPQAQRAIGRAYMHPQTARELLALSQQRTAAWRRERNERDTRVALFAHLPILTVEVMR